MCDLAGCVRELFPNLERERMFLAGLSMGGFGALRLGMKYSSQVAGISAHSSVTDVSQLTRFIPYPAETFLHAGEADVSLLYWAKKNRDSLPPLRFDCGTNDPLIEENRALHRALAELNIPHQYEEFPGGHDWPYWTQHVRRTLTYFSNLAG
jgi:S-formylglutathione hydrolase FrmB